MNNQSDESLTGSLWRLKMKTVCMSDESFEFLLQEVQDVLYHHRGASDDSPADIKRLEQLEALVVTLQAQ